MQRKHGKQKFNNKIKPQTHIKQVKISLKLYENLRTSKYKTLFIFNTVIQQNDRIIKCELLHLP